jgi:hypothetical protein
MHTFHNVSHKGILSDGASVGRVLDIIQRYGRVSSSGSSKSQQRFRRSDLVNVAGAKQTGFFSFLKFVGEPFQRWNFTASQEVSRLLAE